MTTRSRLAAHALTLGLLLPGSMAVVQAQEAAFQAPEAIAATALSYLREQLGPPRPAVHQHRPAPQRAPDALRCHVPVFAVRHEAALPDDRGHPLHRAQSLTAYVQASVSVPGQYYVASRTIAAGQALTPADLAPRDGDLVALPRARSPTRTRWPA